MSVQFVQTCTISYTFIVHSKFPDTGSLYLLKLFFGQQEQRAQIFNESSVSITLYSYTMSYIISSISTCQFVGCH